MRRPCARPAWAAASPEGWRRAAKLPVGGGPALLTLGCRLPDDALKGRGDAWAGNGSGSAAPARRRGGWESGGGGETTRGRASAVAVANTAVGSAPRVFGRRRRGLRDRRLVRIVARADSRRTAGGSAGTRTEARRHVPGMQQLSADDGGAGRKLYHGLAGGRAGAFQQRRSAARSHDRKPVRGRAIRIEV